MQKFRSVVQPIGPDCQGKVTQLVLAYTGNTCASSSNTQVKDACAPNPLSDGPLGSLFDFTLVKDPAKVGAPSINGDEITLTSIGSNFGSETIVEVTGDNGMQLVTIHTSCSQDLNIGDTFGSLEVVGMTTTEGGTLPLSPADPTSSCEFPLINPSCDTAGKPTSLTFAYDESSTCASSMNGQPSDKFDCSEEPDGVALGAFDDVVLADPAEVEVAVDNSSGELLLTFTRVGGGRLSSTTAFDLVGADATQSIEMHTSCSQPLAAGDVFGGLTLVVINGQQLGAQVDYSYVITNLGETIDIADLTVFDNPLGTPVCSPDSGSLAADGVMTCAASTFIDDPIGSMVTNTVTVTGPNCSAEATATVEVKPPPPCEVVGGDLRIRSDKVEWELLNAGFGTATIESIEIAWPVDVVGSIDKTKRCKKTISSEEFTVSPATIDSASFTDDVKARQIKSGKTEKIKFEFSGSGSTVPEDYAITVNFEQGCSVVFEPPMGDFDVMQGAFSCDKPITELTMIWNGGQDVIVQAFDGDANDDFLGEMAVTQGMPVTFNGFTSRPNNKTWVVYDANRVKLGESVFHVSCSDDDMDDPEDCGLPQGDGKENDPARINDWLLEGMLGSTSRLTCTPGDDGTAPQSSDPNATTSGGSMIAGLIEVEGMSLFGGSIWLEDVAAGDGGVNGPTVTITWKNQRTRHERDHLREERKISSRTSSRIWSSTPSTHSRSPVLRPARTITGRSSETTCCLSL